MKHLKNFFIILLVFICMLIIISTNWAINTFDNLNIDEIIFQLLVPMTGANTSYFYNYAIYALIPILILTAVISFFMIFNYSRPLKISLKINKLNREISLGFLVNKAFYLSLLVIISIYYSFSKLDLIDYVKLQLTSSNFIEENYVDPLKVKIEFPKKKKNLIYIYLESMESSYTNIENGGIQSDNLIPKLTTLAKHNVNFSNSEKLGGFYSTAGASWTIGAMVAQSGGIPLKLAIDGNGYSKYENFLPGLTNIGDILEKEGYNQMIMFGSDATFAGRKNFYEQHGDYEIYDLYSAIDENKMTMDDYVWWGFEDKDLYTYAKEKLHKLAKQDAPFNFTMLTVDTHAYDGYLSPSCSKKFDSQYANVIYCADKQIDSFVKWLKKQSFYKDTVVVIVGDHLTMDKFYINEEFDYTKRTGYNVILNSKVEPIRENNRAFTSLDMFPTTLAAMGVKIEGDKLGLGVNLFSDEPTLTEKYGYGYVELELSKKSTFYTKNFIVNK